MGKLLFIEPLKGLLTLLKIPPVVQGRPPHCHWDLADPRANHRTKSNDAINSFSDNLPHYEHPFLNTFGSFESK